MTDQTSIPDGYLKNARGELIPEANVKPEDKLEDELVKKLVPEARWLRDNLARFKSYSLLEAGAFKELVAEKYGAAKGGAKGNMTLRSFDGSMEVQVALSESIDLHSAQLQAAKALIDECVIRWSEGANDQIKALVDHAFQVNKEGRIDTARVLGLRRLDMGGDAQWASAMEAISDAVRVTGSKTYIRFYERDPKTEIRRAIPLDLAGV